MADKRFSARAARLLQNLLTQPSVRAAAKASGLSERQAYRLIHEPLFREKFDEARHASSALAFSIAETEMAGSVLALVSIRDDPRASAAARVSAVAQILEMGREIALEQAREARLIQLRQELKDAKGLDGEDALPALPAPREGRESR